MELNNINIDLDNTITCGQCFRWIRESDNSYTIILKDRIVNLKKDNKKLFVDSNKKDNLKEIIENYLDLNNNYETINEEIVLNDNSFKKYVNKSKGFRIINQDPFETVISYVISQNNNVKRIMKSIELLSLEYGEKVIFKNKEYHLFPKLDNLNKLLPDDLRKYGVGFRDKYLYDVIQNISNNNLNLDLIWKMNSDDALKYLMKNKGIGTKVASCILLFSYKKYDVFPIDTWVKKSFLEIYPNITNNQKAIEEFAKKTYGKYSGIALQYLFNYKRNKDSIK